MPRPSPGPSDAARRAHHGAASFRRGPSGFARQVAIAIALVMPLVLAFSGGAYDLVARQRFGIGLLFALALGLVFGLVPRARPGRGYCNALVALAVLIFLTACSVLWSESAERTTAELARVCIYGGVVALVGYGVHSRAWRDVSGAVTIATVVVLLASLLSRTFPDSFADLGIVIVQSERLLYPLGYWNAVAAWSAMAFALCLALSAHTRRPLSRSLATAALPLALTVSYLTYSRGGTIAVSLAAATVLALAPHRRNVVIHLAAAVVGAAITILVIRSHPEIAQGTGAAGANEVLGAVFLAMAAAASVGAFTRTSRARNGSWGGRSLILAGGALAALAAGAALLVGAGVSTPAADRAVRPGYPAQGSDPATRLATLEGTRDELWASALRAFAANPVQGIGPGTYEFWWNRDGDDSESVRDAHSLYLEMAAELGLPGLAALVTFLGALLVHGVRGWQAARTPGDAGVAAGLLGAYLVFLFYAAVDWVWESTAVAVLALTCVCVAGASASPAAVASRRSRKWVAIASGIAVIAGMVQIPGVVSAERVRASAAELRVGEPESALADANEAIAAQPWAASPYAQRSIAELARNDLPAARADALAAIEREKTNWRHRFLLAIVLSRQGNDAEARRAFEDAEILGPRGRAGADGARGGEFQPSGR